MRSRASAWWMCGFQDSRVHLSRMRQIGSGYQPMDEDTLVCNEEVSKDPLDGIATLNDSAKGRLYCVKLDAGKTARSTKVHVPKQVAAEENDVIVLQNNGAAAQRIYSAYSEGRLKGSYAEFSSAVQAAYDGMGLVTDENDRVVWVRANRSDAKTIRDVQNMAGTVSRYLSDMADGKTTSSDGTELIDARGLTLNQILYFVYAGMPVVAYLGDGSYGLILDTTRTTSPVSGIRARNLPTRIRWDSTMQRHFSRETEAMISFVSFPIKGKTEITVHG